MSEETILDMKGFTKSFGMNPALKDVSFALAAREIHGLLGGNGAGKTTLMNILYGLYRADGGEILLHGKRVVINSPKDAIQQRIGMVHQQFLQIKSLTVLENVVIGTQVKHRFNLKLVEEEDKIRRLCEHFSLEIDPQARIEDLSMGARQKVEILKALYRGAEILILDEPTTNLTPQEVDSLFQSLRTMVTNGLSIVFITHKLREVLAVCDRITVLRNGQNVLTLGREESSEEAFVRAMVGDEINLQESVIFSQKGIDKAVEVVGDAVMLKLERVTCLNEENRPLVKDVTFEIRAGEILGVAGVAANGQRELCETIFGVLPASSGSVWFDDREITRTATQDLLASGMAYIPEDCLRDGYLPKANVAQNLILGFHHQAPYSSRRFMNWDTIVARVQDLIREYRIKTLGPAEIGANLSGGNIQRVVVARAFSQPCKLLVAHNPTRGLDIPSIDFVYNRLLERKQQGMATLLLSENLDELLLLCNRIAVLYRGEIVGLLAREQFEKYEIGRMMSGVRAN